MDESKTVDVGRKIRALRRRAGLSVRQLAKLSDVTAAMISCVERGKSSPSLTTMQKIVYALNTDMATFFSESKDTSTGPVFLREQMCMVMDEERNYTILYPKANGLNVEMLDEQIHATERKPEFEQHKCDVAGCVISGTLTLEIEDEKTATLRPGDAFYIKKGRKHRGYAKTGSARLITVYSPGKF